MCSLWMFTSSCAPQALSLEQSHRPQGDRSSHGTRKAGTAIVNCCPSRVGCNHHSCEEPVRVRAALRGGHTVDEGPDLFVTQAAPAQGHLHHPAIRASSRSKATLCGVTCAPGSSSRKATKSRRPSANWNCTDRRPPGVALFTFASRVCLPRRRHHARLRRAGRPGAPGYIAGPTPGTGR